MSLHRLLLALGSVPLVMTLWQHAIAQETNASPTLTPVARTQEASVLTRTAARRTAVVLAVDRVKDAVVNIHSERTVAGGDLYALSPSQSRVNGMGTGILIDHRGYIVTNHHVVEDVSLLRIRLADGATRNALVVARAPEVDLALIKIDMPKALPVMPLGTSHDLMVGETVIALGNAYGYEHTVSLGIVSAVKRDVSLNKEMSYKQLIQTDASINPGNSGGPLVNIHGELVGVNVAIRAGAQGIGFAIPVDHMVSTVTEMLRQRRRPFSYDGLATRDRLRNGGDGLVRTVLVEGVDDGSPAAQAGVQTGDELVQIADIAIACSYDVERGFMDRRAGERVPMVLRRAGKEQRLELTLATPDRTAVRPAAAAPSQGNEVVWSKLGVQLSPVAGEQIMRLNKQLHGGLEVTDVETEGVAAKAGIRKGDILVGLHQWETLSVDNVVYVLNHPELGTFNPLSFFILRGGQVRKGNLPPVN